MPNTPRHGESESVATTSGAAVCGPMVVVPSGAESLIREISQLADPQEQQNPMDNFDADLIVIGAGPGGYVAAIRAAQLGAKVIVVERQFLGGTCLNWGCIPSKAILAGVERLHQVKTAGALGVEVTGEVKLNFDKLMERKTKVVTTLRGGVGALFKRNGIQHVEGTARFLDGHAIEVASESGKKTLRAKNFILATGASAIRLRIPGLEGGREDGVWTSDDAVTAPYVPKRMLILGGGAVGVEFGTAFHGLGAEVTIVELLPELIPLMDAELGKELNKLLGRKGIKVRVGAGLEKCERVGNAWKCTVKKGDAVEEIEVDVVLLGVGRKANTDGLDLEKVGVKLHKKGVELVDDTMRTHVPSIFAIGDVTGRIQLAHVASAEGIVAATNAVTGSSKKMDYRAVPSCVYTNPEVASVGLTEEQAKEQGHDVLVGKFLFRPLGKAMATGDQDGFVKVVADRKYGEVLGVHMIGAHVTDMIMEGVVAIKLEATVEAMVDAIHAHPTMSEAVLEAFEDVEGHAIHKG